VSSVFERSPGWAPWESHPVDDRRNVASVPCGGVLAATAHGEMGVALVKALLDANICSPDSTQGGSFQPTYEVVPAQCDLPGTVASTYEEVADDG
jgi:hypothetical protein